MRHYIRKTKWFFYSFKRGMKNLIAWTPIIWKDRDFDYGYLLTMLEKKLSRMEEFFLNGNTYSKDAEKYGKEMKIARILVQRIHNEDYLKPYFNSKDIEHQLMYQDMLQKQDIDYLFNLMKKRILYWWD